MAPPPPPTDCGPPPPGPSPWSFLYRAKSYSIINNTLPSSALIALLVISKCFKFSVSTFLNRSSQLRKNYCFCARGGRPSRPTLATALFKRSHLVEIINILKTRYVQGSIINDVTQIWQGMRVLLLH